MEVLGFVGDLLDSPEELRDLPPLGGEVQYCPAVHELLSSGGRDEASIDELVQVIDELLAVCAASLVEVHPGAATMVHKEEDDADGVPVLEKWDPVHVRGYAGMGLLSSDCRR